MTERCSCCIAGGGRAGMVLGLLLARAGVDVMGLVMHAGFQRGFRGDTMHPASRVLRDELRFRLSRRPDDQPNPMSIFGDGRIFVLINRETYWQCGYVIAKGTIDEIRRKGLDAFRESIARIVPYVRDRVGELRSWDDVS